MVGISITSFSGTLGSPINLLRGPGVPGPCLLAGNRGVPPGNLLFQPNHPLTLLLFPPVHSGHFQCNDHSDKYVTNGKLMKHTPHFAPQSPIMFNSTDPDNSAFKNYNFINLDILDFLA